MININDQLIGAARRRHTDKVAFCLNQSGCDPLARTGTGYSALMLAAMNGHYTCVRLLLPVSDPFAVNLATVRRCKLQESEENPQWLT